MIGTVTNAIFYASLTKSFAAAANAVARFFNHAFAGTTLPHPYGFRHWTFHHDAGPARVAYWERGRSEAARARFERVARKEALKKKLEGMWKPVAFYLDRHPLRRRR